MTLRAATFVALLGGLLQAAARAPKRSPELVAKGKATYGIYCVACHGETGAGDGSVAPTLNPRPRNFATEKFRQGSKVEQVFETLRTGVPGTAMVKFTNLSEEERWALSWYVLELRSRGNSAR